MRLKPLLLACSLATATAAAAQDFDPKPWLADLEQARLAMHARYSNLEWLEQERELKLDSLFDEAAERLSTARNEREVLSVFSRLERRIGDGHVRFDPPEPMRPAPRAQPPSAKSDGPCKELGYSGQSARPGTVQALAGYRPLAGDPNIFAAGLVKSDGATVGLVRIPLFQPHAYPQLCSDAVEALKIPANQPCDETCDNKIITWAYRRMGQSLERRLVELKQAGADVLVVDITGNGGGSEWAEAAARMMTPRQLVSARHGFVRGEHWARQWGRLAEKLRDHAAKAKGEDRRLLIGLAAKADSAAAAAATPCAATDRDCERIGSVGFSTGLIGSAPSGSFAGKDWAVDVFNPAQHHYRDGVWSGPLIILVDNETWSAAEQFAAVLQDNRAAVVLGARTGGAGCGYSWGGHPTKLANSGAILQLPDCVRFRADGSNEVRGIIPDEMVGIRASDGAALRARMVAERLPAAIDRARALAARR